MNTMHQAVHVARKDARMSRWFLLAFVTITLFAGIQAAELLPANLPLSDWFGGIVLLLGLYVAGHIVQADSPMRDDAFWATRPLQPTGVYSAKLLTLAALMLVVSAAHFISMLTHAVPAREVAGLLSDVLLAQAVIFSVALLVAAVTRDTRTFMLTLVVGMVVWLMLIGGITAWRFSNGGEVEWPVTIPYWTGKAVFVVGVIVLVAAQYRTGRRATTVALALPLFALMAAARITQPETAGYSFTARALEDDSVRAAENTSGLTFTYDPDARAPDGEIGVFGRVNGPPQQQLHVLVGGVVHMRRTDGRTEKLPLAMPMLPLNRPVLSRIEGARWLRTHDEMLRSEVSLRIAPERIQEQGAPSLQTATPVAVRGETEVFTPRLVARIPLETGAQIASGGRRVRVLNVVNGTAGPEAKIKISQIRSASDNRPLEIGRLVGMFGSSEYALLDRKNGVVRQMRSARSTGTSMGFLMVPDATQNVIELVPVQLLEGESAPPVSDDLELLIYDWRAAERKPLNAPITAK